MQLLWLPRTVIGVAVLISSVQLQPLQAKRNPTTALYRRQPGEAVELAGELAGELTKHLSIEHLVDKVVDKGLELTGHGEKKDWPTGPQAWPAKSTMNIRTQVQGSFSRSMFSMYSFTLQQAT
ncbi:hypothetical protein BJ085DRAFT_31910 [Dimargaris cristalligena]|uniref:Uncharacterized protein n=1 Tax=Dimargaris cristalligena TaxID=215637 RepID=A0A4P9ZV13_9FUNG|nr:hypothetical protein BJ085DRAFT_31910 [Dimargaris cristalligena]|eukprot:RKP36662.1 hypothetical protein BJ085DRAFT_31910 [Dimargaris cristalligena]